MKSTFLIAFTALAVFAAPALAGSEVLPVHSAGFLNYHLATGEITPVTVETRRVGSVLWSAGYEYVGYVFNRSPDAGHAASDWGDVGGPAVVGSLEFSSFTNSMDADGDLWILLLYYEEDDGFGSAGKVYVSGLLLANVPSSNHSPSEYWGYRWRVELVTPFVLDGSDLDGDGLGDFGYFMYCSGRTPGCVHGSGLWDRALIDPNNLPPEAPGVEDAVDAYTFDPNGTIDPNDINAAYVGTYTFTNAWGQMHQVLFTPPCPNRGDSGRYCQADIDGSADCVVGLADLAQLLSNYGLSSGATLSMGDVDPYGEWFSGDGDVDLADLAELLGQYGDDCNWP
jgi:hypothetical protein